MRSRVNFVDEGEWGREATYITSTGVNEGES